MRCCIVDESVALEFQNSFDKTGGQRLSIESVTCRHQQTAATHSRGPTGQLFFRTTLRIGQSAPTLSFFTPR